MGSCGGCIWLCFSKWNRLEFCQIKFCVTKAESLHYNIIAPVYHHMPAVDDVIKWIGTLLMVILIVDSNLTMAMMLCS